MSIQTHTSHDLLCQFVLSWDMIKSVNRIFLPSQQLEIIFSPNNRQSNIVRNPTQVQLKVNNQAICNPSCIQSRTVKPTVDISEY